MDPAKESGERMARLTRLAGEVKVSTIVQGR